MKRKLLMTVALTGLLGTGLYAYGGNMQGMDKGMSCPSGMKSSMMKKHKKMKDFGVMGLIRDLNLSSEQMKDIQEIKQDMMKNKVKSTVAFSKDGFDKEKYIEIMKQKRDNMLESKAEMIDRVYKVLTSEQKEQLKVLMDLREEKMASMMKKRMRF
ncbi:Spy/CpxP family protein refolding chaperone [Halarcobacter sp.]|uniref:Spy/CpxP family protein refolding chaperone n=1 Tax=Halarcobacter sp. TaxID=2321133 RepID=UPI0029F4BC1B|nr:Spy/CpxP family protein refolding chaperone [Halarcobacter sp.]